MASFALFNFEFEPIQNKLRQAELKGMESVLMSASEAFPRIHKRDGSFCVLFHIFLMIPSLTPVILLIWRMLAPYSFTIRMMSLRWSFV